MIEILCLDGFTSNLLIFIPYHVNALTNYMSTACHMTGFLHQSDLSKKLAQSNPITL